MENPTLQSVQQSLDKMGLTPRTRIARLCVVTGLLSAVWSLVGMRVFPTGYSIAVSLFMYSVMILAYRAFKKHFMWRLRNRLIVTYMFIGVIPLILLATMGIVAGFLFAGQFSTFVITTDVNNELRRLESANRALTHQLAAAIRRRGSVDTQEFTINSEVFPGRQVTVYYRGKVETLPGSATRNELAPPQGNAPESAISVDNGDLFLRAVNRARISETPGDELVMVSSVPLNKQNMESIVANMGLINLYSLLPSSSRPQSSGLHIDSSASSSGLSKEEIESSTMPKVTCGSLPPPISRMDLEFRPFATVLNTVHWRNGQPGNLLLTVRTRPSLLYFRLFRTLGDMTNAILILLVAIAVVFALIEVVALVIGVRLTRTMTSSVAKLYDATQHVNKGDFAHRIVVSSQDQLASLESSFNSMTASIEKLVAEQKEKQRIESELHIAKEVQDLLFPRDVADLDGLELHGICRPARTVSGDYYDFLPVGPSAVGLAVGDISGKGISAALMMATVHAFVRAHTMVEPLPAMAAALGAIANILPGENTACCPSPGTVLAQLNQQLFRSTPAQKYATMFLGFYDQQNRQLNYSNAGHLPPIVICANGTTHNLSIGGTVVGLFGDMVYPEGMVTLNPGDIVVAYSDGITEPENDFGDFGEERLAQIVQENSHLPLPRISEAILSAVIDWIGGEEQPDDMTIVLARAR